MLLGREWQARDIYRLFAEHVPESEFPVEEIAASSSITWKLHRAKSMMPNMESIREFSRYAINLGQYGAVVSDLPAAPGD